MKHTDNSLETHDYSNAIKIATSLEHCYGIEDFRKLTLSNSLEFIGAETSVFFLLSDEKEQKSPSLSRGISLGSSSEVLSSYVTNYSSLDPIIKYVTHTSPLQHTDVFRLEDIVDYRQLVDTQYYQEFLQPSSIHHLLAVKLGTSTHCAGLMGLHRSKSDKPFSSVELEKAKLLAPLLAMALGRILYMDEANKTNRVLKTFEAEFSTRAFILLDSDFLPIYKTEAAHNYLCGFTGSSSPILDSLITSWRHAADRLLKENDLHTLTVRTPIGSSLCIARLQRKLTDSAQEYWSVNLLGVKEDELKLDERFTMTPRQMEIVKLVSGGLSNKEIARVLKISVKTVENHLYSIYSALGVNSRTMLVHVLGQEQWNLSH